MRLVIIVNAFLDGTRHDMNNPSELKTDQYQEYIPSESICFGSDHSCYLVSSNAFDHSSLRSWPSHNHFELLKHTSVFGILLTGTNNSLFIVEV